MLKPLENEIYVKGLILPPGLHELADTPLGSLILKVRDIVWLKAVFPHTRAKLRVRFFGDKRAGLILRAQNSEQELRKQLPSGARFSIVTPPVQFR